MRFPRALIEAGEWPRNPPCVAWYCVDEPPFDIVDVPALFR